jgi:hypothetical protein
MPNLEQQDALLAACRCADVEAVRAALAAGADARFVGHLRDATPLALAANTGCAELVELLIPLSDVHARDGWGRTALIVAAADGAVDCLRLLLPHSDLAAEWLSRQEVKAIEPVSRDPRDALAEAIYHGCADAVRLLAQATPTAAARSRSLAQAMRGWWRQEAGGALAVSDASSDEQIQAVLAMEPLVDWNWRDERGRALLSYAVFCGIPALVSLALRHCPARGACPQAEWPLFAMEPTIANAADIARVLLSEADALGERMPPGALSPRDGRGALSALARFHHCGAFMRSLLRAGGHDPLHLDQRGRSALHAAAESLNPEAIEALAPFLDGAAPDADGFTPLALAVSQFEAGRYPEPDIAARALSLLFSISDARDARHSTVALDRVFSNLWKEQLMAGHDASILAVWALEKERRKALDEASALAAEAALARLRPADPRAGASDGVSPDGSRLGQREEETTPRSVRRV